MTERTDDLPQDAFRPIAPGESASPLGRSADSVAEQSLAVEGEAGRVQASGVRGALTIWLFREGSAPQQVSPDNLADLVTSEANFVWVELTGFGEEEARLVSGALALDERVGQMLLAEWQRPHLEIFDDHFLVSATIPRADAESRRILAGQLDLIVGRNYLVSAHKLSLPFAERVFARARQNPDLARRDSTYMLYIVLDELLGAYEGLSDEVAGAIERIEERALAENSDTFLGDLLGLKRFAFTLGRLASQHSEVFASFLRPDLPSASRQEVLPYFRDLGTRLDRLVDTLAAARESVNGAFDLYVSHVAHRTNNVMKVLTIVSTVLLPSTLILGLFGTQFQDVPLYGREDFVVMIVLIALVSGTILLTFRRKGWL